MRRVTPPRLLLNGVCSSCSPDANASQGSSAASASSLAAGVTGTRKKKRSIVTSGSLLGFVAGVVLGATVLGD